MMACECVDGNGSLMETCLGTCGAAKMEQYYSQRLMDCESSMNQMLKQFHSNLKQVERDIEESFKDLYLEGFRKGFEMAKDLYE